MYDDFRWSKNSVGRLDILREYEPIQPFFLPALARKVGARTFLDVGANVGVYSLFMSTVPTIERIVAFEPSAETLAELRQNIADNGLVERIIVEDRAVSSEVGEVSFGVVGARSGANSVVGTSIHARTKFQHEVIVQTTTLDTLFAGGVPQPICAKIDVEGHELDVLRGGISMLRQHQGILQLERYDTSDASLQDFLAGLGYRVLTHIGPDFYFTNVATLDDAVVVQAVFEEVAQTMIDANHARAKVRPVAGPPISLRLPGGFAIQLGGTGATALRQVKKRFGGGK